MKGQGQSALSRRPLCVLGRVCLPPNAVTELTIPYAGARAVPCKYVAGSEDTGPAHPPRHRC